MQYSKFVKQIQALLPRMILLTFTFLLCDITHAQKMSYFQDKSASQEYQFNSTFSKKRIKRWLADPSILLNVCTHLSAFNSDSTKVAMCDSKTASGRNACETYQYCTWNNGVNMLGSAGQKCDQELKEAGVPETAEITVAASDVFPDKCSTWCLGLTGLGPLCAGFEMKLWSGLYRCRAMTSALVGSCTTFKSDPYYSHYSQSYTQYQAPATALGRCTHVASQNSNYAQINTCKNKMTEFECSQDSLCSFTGCADTTGWNNGAAETCTPYGSTYCTGSTYNSAYFFKGGAEYLFPEQNCCYCGKATYNPSYSTAPSTSDNVCTHLPTQNGVAQIVTYCQSLTSRASCVISANVNICKFNYYVAPLTILANGSNRNVCTHKSASNLVFSEVSACSGYGSNDVSCKADSKCTFLFYQAPLTLPVSKNLCTHDASHNQDESIVTTCGGFGSDIVTCEADAQCAFLFWQDPLTTPTSKNVCTHKSASNTVYFDVTACALYGTDRASCEGNSKCLFLFYQEPLTGVPAENQCTHLSSYNTDETNVLLCSGYDKTQCQAASAFCSYIFHQLPLTDTAHYNLCTHLPTFNNNEAQVTSCSTYSKTQCSLNANCLWGFYQLPLSIQSSKNECTHLDSYKYLNEGLVLQCEVNDKEQCQQDSNCIFLFWQEPLEDEKEDNQNNCTHNETNNADEEKVIKCSNLEKTACDADDDCWFIFWQIPLTNSTVPKPNVCTHLEAHNYDESIVDKCSNYTDRVECDADQECVFIYWKLPLTLNTSKNNCTHNISSSSDGVQVAKCQSFKTKDTCEADPLCFFLFWEEPKTIQGCSHEWKWNENHAAVEACKLLLIKDECNNHPNCQFFGQQCKDAITPKSTEKLRYFSKYKQTKDLKEVEAKVFDMFVINDKINCRIKSCELQDSQCTSAYSGKYLTLSEDSQILKTQQNIESGFDERICMTCISNEGHYYSQKVQVLQGEMANVKPSLKDDKLEYFVTVGLQKFIKVPGVTRDIKHDGSAEAITVEHLTSENDYATINESNDTTESAFNLIVKTKDENMIGQTKKIQFRLRSSNGQVSDKYSIELKFIKNAAPVFDLKVLHEEQETLYERFVKYKSLLPRTPEDLEKFWKENSPIVANITDIDNFGRVTLMFDSKVQVYEMKNINASALELILIPRDSDQNMTNLKFNFTCVEFISTQIVLQLTFENPAYISFNMIDTLELKVLHPAVFKNSKKQKRELQGQFLFVPKNYTTLHKLPQQMEPSFGKNYKSIVEGAEKAVNSLTVATVIINISFGMSLYFLWGLINALQMMIYNPLANIRFPLNVMMLYGILLPITSLDMIPPEISTDVVFTMSEGDAYSDILEQMGYDSNNFIYNLGSLFYIFWFMVASLVLLGISYVVKLAFRQFKENLDESTRSLIKKMERKISKTLRIKNHYYYKALLLNNMFLIFYEGYIEILLSCYLNNQGSVRKTKSDEFSFIISYVFGFVCLFIIPLCLIFMISRKEETLRQVKSYISYGSMYDGLDTQSKWCLLYNFLFIYRRQVLLYIMFNDYYRINNSLQIVYMVYLNFFIMMYVQIVCPFRARQKNTIEKVNELCVFLSVEMMMFFTDMLDPVQQFLAGYIAIGIIVLNVCYNMFIILQESYRPIWLTAKKYYNRIRDKWCPVKPKMSKLMLLGLENPQDGPEAPRLRGLVEYTMREKEIEFLEEKVKKLKHRSRPTSQAEARAHLAVLYANQIDLISNRKQLPSNKLLQDLNQISYFDFCVVKLHWYNSFSRREKLVQQLNEKLMHINKKLIQDRNEFLYQDVHEEMKQLEGQYNAERPINIFNVALD